MLHNRKMYQVFLDRSGKYAVCHFHCPDFLAIHIINRYVSHLTSSSYLTEVLLALNCFSDRDEALLRSRNRALHKDEILIRIDADDLEVLDRDALAAHLSRHAFALEYAARIGG